MKQWRIDINPKCANGDQLYITSKGIVRPCVWINERSKEKDLFDKNNNFNLSYTDLDEIVNIHIKKFVDGIKEDPFNGLKVCFYECADKKCKS